MKLEERLRELESAEDMLNDAKSILRAAMLTDKREYIKREKLITEALFKVSGALNTVKHLRVSTEMKKKRKHRGLGA
jgi:threonine dehydratase